MAVSNVEEFLNGPLVTWFSNCLETTTDERLTYEELVDGVLIHHVFLQMNLYAQDNEVSPSNDMPALRERNLNTVLSNLRHFYEEEKGHVILQLPNIARLANEPRLNVRETELLLCLLLGCAVQCPNNEEFIEKITQLDESSQGSIAECIKQVVHIPNIVLSPEMLIRTSMESDDAHCANVQKAFEYVRQVYREHKKLRGLARKRLSETRNDEDDEVDDELQSVLDCLTRSEREEARKRDTELLEWKAKVRAQRQELKERGDDLHECRAELIQCKEQLTKMQKEKEILILEARTAKSYRDELDAANEKAEKVDRLEQEIARYKEKLASVDYYKIRLNELKEDNQLLIESKEVLVEQINSYKAKAVKTLNLEKQILELKQQVVNLTVENAANCEKYQELHQENAELERLLKVSTKEALDNGFILETEESSISMNSSVSEQLTTSAQSQALKLELENRRLSNLVDSLKENSYRENSSKVLDLEKERKKLSLTIDALKEDIKRITQKNEQLENIYKAALKENERLQHQELKDLNLKNKELEEKYATVVLEKMHLQTLLESLQERSLDLESSLNDANQEIEEKKVIKDAVNETKIKQMDLQSKITALESEKQSALQEVEKQSQIIEEKLDALEASKKIIEDLEKKVEKLEKQTNESTEEVLRLKNLVQLIDKNSTNTIKRKPLNKNNNEETILKNFIGSFELQSEQTALKLTNNQLIAEKEILLKSREKLSNDQEHLKTLYDQLNNDYQQLLQERNSLRSQLRDAKLKLQNQNKSIYKLESVCKFSEQECKNLKSSDLILEHLQLQEDFSKLYKDFDLLKSQHQKAKSDLYKFSNKQTNHQEELNAKNKKIIKLDLQINKLNNRLETLLQLNDTLFNDKTMLMEHVSQLLKQNRELIVQSLEDKEHYHNEELKNTDRVNNLSRQKEKLEEKIMDQYRKLENSSTKKKNSANIVKTTFSKVKKASSELFNRNRRSWAEETSAASERSFDFEYCRGHESDVSLDDHKLRESRESCVSDYIKRPESRESCVSDYIKRPESKESSDYLKKPKSRKSIDFLDNFCPEDFKFGDNNDCGQLRSRNSEEFLDLCFFNNGNENENNDELDNTLHDSSNNENIYNFKDTEIPLYSNKPVDLSFEDKKNTKNADEKSETKEIIDSINQEKEKPKSSQPIWMEIGCV